MNNQIMQVATSDGSVISPYPDIKQVRSIAVYGSQVYAIGLDGYFYIRIKNCWIRVDFE